MLQPGDEEIAEALLIYRRACQRSHEHPEGARRDWIDAGNKLGMLAAATNDMADGWVFFLWRMSRRRAMMEIGAETWGDKVHQW